MNGIIRLVLLSLAFAVCQCHLCSSATSVSCLCCNEKKQFLFTTSHTVGALGRWNTEINRTSDSCESQCALDLWIDMYDCNDGYEMLSTIPPRPPRLSIHSGNSATKPVMPPTGEHPSVSEMIRKGYEKHGTSLYKFHTITESWENTRRICMSEGAHLAIINSKEEAQVLKLIFSRYPSVSNTMNNAHALIGFHDQYNEGDYLTIFGDPIEVAGFNEWMSSYPQNDGKLNETEAGANCGGFHREGNLVDLRCYGKYAFFCEVEDGGYVFNSEINYIAGHYTGVEAVIKPPPGTARRLRPSRGYTYYTDIGFYKVHTRTTTWENARRTCESEGAHLAIINSLVESAALIAEMSKHTLIIRTRYPNYAFIGFHDQYIEGQFLTIFNETLRNTGFHQWFTSKNPDDLHSSDIREGEDCGSMYRNGQLNDLSCHVSAAFICEQSLLV